MTYKFIQQPKTRPNNISTPDNLTWAQIAKIVQEMFEAGCTYHNKAQLEQYAKEHGLTFKDKALVSIMIDRYISNHTAAHCDRRK